MLLQNQADKRLSPFKLLKHPFITRYQKIAPPLEENYKQYIIEKMFKYHTLSSLVRLIRNLIISSGLAKQEEPYLYHFFDTLDRDKDGRICFNELQIQLWQVYESSYKDKVNFNKIFTKVDMDKDGYLGFTEFRASILESSVFKDREICLNIFSFIDKNKDGKITKEDLEHLFVDNYGIINSGLKSIFEGFNKIKANQLEKEEFINYLQKMAD